MSVKGQSSCSSCLFCSAATPPLGKEPRVRARTTFVNEDGETVAVKLEDGVEEEEGPGDGVDGPESGGFILSAAAEDDLPIQDDLRAFFIVRKVLDLPEGKCEEYLQWAGGGYPSPGSWFGVCGKCNGMVKECYQTYQQIRSLEGGLMRMKQNLKKLMWDSIPSCRSRSRGRAVGRPKRRLVDDIRKCVLLGVTVTVADSNGITPTVQERESVDKPPVPDPAPPPPKIRPIKESQGKGVVKLPTKQRTAYNYKCHKCPAVFRHSNRCKEHDLLHSRNSGSKCPHCGWLCPMGSLVFHVRRHHPNPVKWHLRKRHKVPKKVLKHNYKRVQVVSEEVPYYCDHCHMIFTSETRLAKHCRENHGEKPLYPWTCEKCPAAEFISKQLRKMHIDKFHPELREAETEANSGSQPTRDGKHQCRRCKESFVSKLKLDFHIAKSHAASLLKCKICHYQAAKFCVLHRHIKDKHKNEKYEESVEVELPPSENIKQEYEEVPFSSSPALDASKRPSQVREASERDDVLNDLDEGSMPWADSPVSTGDDEDKDDDADWNPNKVNYDKQPPPERKTRSARHPENKSEEDDDNNMDMIEMEEEEVDEDEEIPYYCDHCPMIFIRAQGLKKHHYACHLYKPLVSCQNCDAEFISKQLLEMHIEKAHPELRKRIRPEYQSSADLNYNCSKCSELFPSKLKLDYHVAKYHRSSLLKCKLCKFQTKFYNKLLSHTKEQHVDKPARRKLKVKKEKIRTTYKCSECPAVFWGPDRRLVHMKVHATNSGVKCPVCAWVCDERKLFFHLVARHPDYDRSGIEKIDQEIPYYCDHCHMIYTSTWGLRTHLKANHPEMPLLPCGACSSGFHTKQLLRIHMEKVHPEVKNMNDEDDSMEDDNDLYRCPLCSEPFHSRQKMDYHVARIHPSSLLKCKICKHQAIRYQKLALHIKEMHGNINYTEVAAAAMRPMKQVKQEPEECSPVPVATTLSISTMSASATKSSDNSEKEELQAELDDDILQWLNSPISPGGDRDADDDAEWNPPRIEEDYEPPPEKKRRSRPRGTPRKTKSEEESPNQSIAKAEGSAASPEPQGSAKVIKTGSKSKSPVKAQASATPKVKQPKKKTSASKIHTYKCAKCPALYPNEDALSGHRDLHNSNSGVKCSQCGWLCKTKGSLFYHVSVRHKPRLLDKEVPYYCDHCHMMFTDASRLRRHHKGSHSEMPSHSCENCGSEFVSKQLMQMHIERDHPNMLEFMDNEPEPGSSVMDEQDQEQQCPHCSETFVSKLKLDFHIAKSHYHKQLECKLCDYKTEKYQKLSNHINSKHEKRKVICEFCSKELTSAKYLSSHNALFHTKELGIDPLRCSFPDCNTIFVSPGALKLHIEHVHKKVKSFYCEFCGKAFARKCDLSKHVLLHTAPRELQYKKGPFICQHCPAGTAIFNVRQGLYYHMKKAHSDKYMFRCEKCGKGYAMNAMLLQHQKDCKSGT